MTLLPTSLEENLHVMLGPLPTANHNPWNTFRTKMKWIFQSKSHHAMTKAWRKIMENSDWDYAELLVKKAHTAKNAKNSDMFLEALLRVAHEGVYPQAIHGLRWALKAWEAQPEQKKKHNGKEALILAARQYQNPLVLAALLEAHVHMQADDVVGVVREVLKKRHEEEPELSKTQKKQQYKDNRNKIAELVLKAAPMTLQDFHSPNRKAMHKMILAGAQFFPVWHDMEINTTWAKMLFQAGCPLQAQDRESYWAYEALQRWIKGSKYQSLTILIEKAKDVIEWNHWFGKQGFSMDTTLVSNSAKHPLVELLTQRWKIDYKDVTDQVRQDFLKALFEIADSILPYSAQLQPQQPYPEKIVHEIMQRMRAELAFPVLQWMHTVPGFAQHWETYDSDGNNIGTLLEKRMNSESQEQRMHWLHAKSFWEEQSLKRVVHEQQVEMTPLKTGRPKQRL